MNKINNIECINEAQIASQNHQKMQYEKTTLRKELKKKQEFTTKTPSCSSRFNTILGYISLKTEANSMQAKMKIT